MNFLHLSAHAPSARPLRPAALVPAVKPGDAAVSVMTDFAHEHPITINEERPIEDALEDMIRFGVRALLVCRGDTVTGLVTSYDIQGERPLKFLQSSTYTRHDEILVGHVMTPWEQVPVLDWEELADATVSDVLALFHATDVTHLLVMQRAGGGSSLVRGLISRTRLERQLRG